MKFFFINLNLFVDNDKLINTPKDIAYLLAVHDIFSGLR